jgi:Zn-dependent peptidase ImmA (M78 family)/transcriptional regulator with XRE-family HTH domain
LQPACSFVKLVIQECGFVAKNIVARVDRNLARRLREARRETGLSTRAVAGKLPHKLTVSHATIAAYEKGVATPPVLVLAALGDIYGRPLNWFLEDRKGLSEFRYRNLRSRVRLSDQRQFEAQASKWVDAYLNLERHLKSHPPRRATVVASHEDVAPDLLAVRVRRSFLSLDDDEPIQNMVGVLESFSTWALEIKSSFGIDGAAARHGDDFVVVLNPEVANDRVRMNAAHELAHVLYDGCKHGFGWTDDDVEKRAYLFASSLLLPESQLKEAFDGKSFIKLIQYKERFGISLAAMIYMAEKSRVINTTTSRWLWAEMARRGWRHAEPGYVWRDRAIRFEMLLESAIQTKALTWADAERVTGVREYELRQRLAGVLPAASAQPDAHLLPHTLKFTSQRVQLAQATEQGGSDVEMGAAVHPKGD